MNLNQAPGIDSLLNIVMQMFLRRFNPAEPVVEKSVIL
jgi:hypothetical protein